MEGTMHLLSNDPLAEVRALRERRRAGEISQGEYIEAFKKINAAHCNYDPCVNNDGRLAVGVIQGRALCEPCYLREKRGC
jgi:hypothetical protein